MFTGNEITKEFSYDKIRLSYNIWYDITPCIIGMFIDSLKQNSILFACLLMNL